MKYRVLIQPTVKAELREAYRWYYNKSPHAARLWLDRLLETSIHSEPTRSGARSRPKMTLSSKQSVSSFTERGVASIGFFSPSRKGLSRYFTYATHRGRT